MADAQEQDGKGEAGEAMQAVADAPDTGDEAASTTDRLKGLVSGNGVPNKLLIPAAIAAAGAAAAYAAKKGAPKLKSSVGSKATEKAEDAAQGALSKAEDQGGITGLGAKLFRGQAEGGGGAGGALSSVASKVTGGGKQPSEGWGKGRRNPIQRWVDVGVPLETAYNQWTQFEEFPKFMHRVVSVEQDDDDRAKVRWQEKIWFSKRQWEAQITEQTPDERIAWQTVSGTRHVGHVSFHRLDDELTRVLVSVDFNPSGLFEKMASGLRFVKRAAESDLGRFKAFIETHGDATGAWRGRIEDGEVVDDPGVEEGKPIEEGKELRTPQGGGKDKKPKGKDDDTKSEAESPDGGEAEADEGERKDPEQLEAERREREQRREERRAALTS